MFTSFDQVKPGLQLPFDNKAERFQKYYEGDLKSLFTSNEEKPANLIDSGLQLIKNRDPVILNIFKVVIDFYNDIQFSNDPSITSTSPRRQQFINENRREVLAELEKAYVQYLIKGRAVLKVDEIKVGETETKRRVRSVKPNNYFPVVNVEDADDIIGHILAYPYSTQVNPNVASVADRVRMVLFQEGGINETRDYIYSGGTLQNLQTSGPSNVFAILQYGNGLIDSLFRDIVVLVQELLIRLTGGSIILNRHTKPDVQAPSSFNRNQVVVSGESRFLPKDKSGEGYEYLTFDGHLQSNTEMIEILVDSISIATGLSKTAFGVSVGGNESGVSRERAMQKQLARTQRDRKLQEMVLSPLFDALGATSGDINIQFVDDPLSHPSEIIQALGQMYSNRVITRDEYRDKTGWGPLTEEQKAELDGSNNSENQGQGIQQGRVETAENPEGLQSQGNA